MNNSISIEKSPACQCQNQNLLSFGETCEICMGKCQGTHPNMPEDNSWYDQDYFEELEAWIDDIEVAA